MDKQEIFPDGTVIDKWFYDITIPELSDLGKQYVLTDNNVLDDGKIHTKEIQNLIDRAYENGGGSDCSFRKEHILRVRCFSNKG